MTIKKTDGDRPKEEIRMGHWMNMNSHMAALLAEDVGAAELRSPLNSGMRSAGWLQRLFGRR